jgi:hypothetical protein
MSASIRGHQGRFEIYENGELKKIFNIKTVEITQDSTFLKSYYVGQPIPEADQAIEGWSGNLDMEVKDSSVDDFIDALITNNLNGIGVSSYTFISTELYADGTQRAYVYVDCSFKMSKHQAGLNEKMTKKLDFQAMFRQKL